jgi:hypothetical protein
MRSTQPARGLVLLAIVTLVAIGAISSIDVGSRPRVAGSPLARSSALPSPSMLLRQARSMDVDAPTPSFTPKPTGLPTPEIDPAPNDDLILAGRDGVPGLLYCGGGVQFDFEALEAPTGAERGVGPEYDVLRSTLKSSMVPGKAGPVREVGRRDRGITFLADQLDVANWEYGPYIYVDEKLDGDEWRWAGTGDCEPRSTGSNGYGAATWELDPAYRMPTSTSQILHLLVHEVSCSSGRNAHGRIGPAYVFDDILMIRIELFVASLPGVQDCQAVDPTPATLRLPEPLGDRSLKDMNAHILTGAGG